MGFEPDKKSLFTKEMFDKAVSDMGTSYGKKSLPTGLFEGAFTGATYTDSDGNRKSLSQEGFLRMGRIHNFVQITKASPDNDYVRIAEIDSSGSSTYREFLLKEEKYIAATSSYSDMLWYKLISAAETVPTMVSPETGIVERMATALELVKDKRKGRVAILVDTDVYNDLNIETGGGYDAFKYWKVNSLGHSTFCGVPVLQAPCPGTGDIYVIDSATTIAFIEDCQLQDKTIRMALSVAEDSVVVSADPNAHIVSKSFDEDTNDWCIDCWTCGYSHWAFEEEEADEKLKAHAENDKARIFYRRES